MSEGASNMVVIHEKQEGKTPLEDSVVYIHDGAGRKSEDVAKAALGAWSSRIKTTDKSWVKSN